MTCKGSLVQVHSSTPPGRAWSRFALRVFSFTGRTARVLAGIFLYSAAGREPRHAYACGAFFLPVLQYTRQSVIFFILGRHSARHEVRNDSGAFSFYCLTCVSAEFLFIPGRHKKALQLQCFFAFPYLSEKAAIRFRDAGG